MKQSKLNINIICGGQSTEHEVSILSARNIARELNKEKYNVSISFIDQTGIWYFLQDLHQFQNFSSDSWIKNKSAEMIDIRLGDSQCTFITQVSKIPYQVDCFFPIVHGTNGEDGVLQGLLEMLKIPYVGANVLSSAICMNKDVTKQLLKAANIKTTPWYTIAINESVLGLYEKLAAFMGSDLFVKPADLGSSVGIQKIKNSIEFNMAVKKARQFSSQVLVEPYIKGREIECSVLGNQEPIVSQPGEIIPSHEFYSYDAKYIDPKGATLTTPANLPPATIEKIQQNAIAAFKALHCNGMLRVDFFVVNDEDVIINEANTLPGFTNISMYPKLWQVSGLSYEKLLDRLIKLAIDKFEQVHALQRKYLATTQNTLSIHS